MMSASKLIIAASTTLMLVATLTTLTASCAKPAPPIVSACVQLGSYATGSVTSSLASKCVCFESTAKRQLDEANYLALDKAAQVLLEKSMSEKKKLIREAVTTRVTAKPSITDFSMTVADFLLLMHKFSYRCPAS